MEAQLELLLRSHLNIFNIFRIPKFPSSQKINIHVHSFLSWRKISVKMANTEQPLDVASSEDRGNAFAVSEAQKSEFGSTFYKSYELKPSFSCNLWILTSPTPTVTVTPPFSASGRLDLSDGAVDQVRLVSHTLKEQVEIGSATIRFHVQLR